jgi:Alpha 1,4-glycosyltransferase conserved region/Glycosyltransferase sugar-binding region containing DXD motif
MRDMQCVCVHGHSRLVDDKCSNEFLRLPLCYKHVLSLFVFILTMTVVLVPTKFMKEYEAIQVVQKLRSSFVDETVRNTDVSTEAPIVFHVAFTLQKFSTLNLRCIESIFYFHPFAHLKLHSNAELGIHTNAHALPPTIQGLIDLGYHIEIVPYEASDVLERAVLMTNSIVNSTAANIWSSFLETKWKHEKYWYSNESNLLRLCLLYTEGGIYLDTDVVLVRPIVSTTGTADGGLHLDNVMARDGKSFHCAVMKFLKKGNVFLGTAINNFLQNYDGTDWGNNGPRVFRRTSKEHPELVCNDVSDAPTQSISMSSPVSDTTNDAACWLQPLPSESFQPVPWREWVQYCFHEELSPTGSAAQEIVMAPGVYAVHLNNLITGDAIEVRAYMKGSICDYVLNYFCIIC